MKQLDLFTIRREEPKRIFYTELTIHEKINYKANLCGFQKIVYGYVFRLLPLHQPQIDRLSEKYAWHHKVNSGNENRINTWMDKQIGQQKLKFN